MFFVSNKYRIISVIIALSTVLILLLISKIIIKQRLEITNQKSKILNENNDL